MLDCRTEPCPADPARALGIEPGNDVVLLHRPHLADGEPIALETARPLPETAEGPATRTVAGPSVWNGKPFRKRFSAWSTAEPCEPS